MSTIPTCAICGAPAMQVKESVERESSTHYYDWVTHVCPLGHETKRRENLLRKQPGMFDETDKWW